MTDYSRFIKSSVRQNEDSSTQQSQDILLRTSFFQHYKYQNYKNPTSRSQRTPKNKPEVTTSQKFRRKHNLVSNNQLQFMLYRNKRLSQFVLRPNPKDLTVKPVLTKPKILSTKIDLPITKTSKIGSKTMSSVNPTMNLFNILQLGSRIIRENQRRQQLNNQRQSKGGIIVQLYFDKIDFLKRMYKHSRLKKRLLYAANFNNLYAVDYQKFQIFHKIVVLSAASLDDQALFAFRFTTLGRPLSGNKLCQLGFDLKTRWPSQAWQDLNKGRQNVGAQQLWQWLWEGERIKDVMLSIKKF